MEDRRGADRDVLRARSLRLMTEQPAEGTSGADHERQEDEEASDSLGVASIVMATIGLFVGLLTVLGLRGVALSLGIVAVVLAGVALRRATTSGQRGTAYGGLALGLVTLTIGAFVARAG